MTLTNRQAEQLDNLKENGKLFVGFNSPSIMRTFECLVEKGFAKSIETDQYGKHYILVSLWHKMDEFETYLESRFDFISKWDAAHLEIRRDLGLSIKQGVQVWKRLYV